MSHNTNNKKEGHIIQWNDDRGFGFIQEDGEAKKIFFHISKIITQSSYRPTVGDKVTFDISYDQKKRINAYNVAIHGISSHTVTPKRTSLLDYFLMGVIAVTLAYIGFAYLLDQKLYLKPETYFICAPALLSYLLLCRAKKPKEDSYCCASCNNRYKFSLRTIRAWNKGVTNFYCKNCYQPKTHENNYHHKTGCLGSIIIFFIIPIGFVFFK